MTKTTTIVSVLAMTAVLGGVAVAGKKKGKKAKPAVPAAVAKLHKLVGEWSGEGSGTMGPNEVTVSFAISCKEASAGYAVLCDSALTIPGMGTIAETDLFGYDAHQDRYHWYAVTAAGETHDHVALPPTGDTYQFVFSGRMDGGAGQEIIDLTLSSDGKSMDFANRGAIDGQSAWSLTAKVTKS